MGGNDKVDALAGTDLEGDEQSGGVQGNFFSDPDN
jgi:hypothetical protein